MAAIDDVTTSFPALPLVHLTLPGAEPNTLWSGHKLAALTQQFPQTPSGRAKYRDKLFQTEFEGYSMSSPILKDSRVYTEYGDVSLLFNPRMKTMTATNTRRNFLKQAGSGASLLTAGLALGPTAAAGQAPQGAIRDTSPGAFWPNGIRLAISISMQFEAGGQPRIGADSPFPKVDFPPSVPSDAAANTWFAYGYREGIPRMLDLWDKHGVKVTSHMIGEAVRRHPALAREIVQRGHEASGHGPRWSSQYAMTRAEERAFLIAGRDMVMAGTGVQTLGYNCNWLRRGPNTLSLLQELGFLYHIDDVSRDEPFIEQVNGKDFAVVPYTLRNNDILLIEGRNYSPEQFLQQIKGEFDQLYEEAGTRRRMMSISAHDRISGSPQMVRVWDQFLSYAKSKAGVAFLRKDEIARFALSSPITVREGETI